MTVRIYPAPQPLYAIFVRAQDDCVVCGNRELLIASRPGTLLGDVIRCPACTRTGAREVARLLRGDVA